MQKLNLESMKFENFQSLLHTECSWLNGIEFFNIFDKLIKLIKLEVDLAN